MYIVGCVMYLVYIVSLASQVFVSRQTSLSSASTANSVVGSKYRSGGEERDLPPKKKIKTVEEGTMGEF